MNEMVLLVDDDVNARIIAETLLRLRDLDVHAATDATDAAAILDHHRVGVVVADLSRPDSPGFHVVRHMRTMRPPLGGTRPRLVALTERHEPELERFAARLGTDALLRKPVHPGELIHTVERFLHVRNFLIGIPA